ncbi:MAG: peptidase T [Bacilli bacterium]
MLNIEERFLRYCQIDTQADDNSITAPSSAKQWDLLNLLKGELDELAIPLYLSLDGILYAHLASNSKIKTDKIGFVAHVDTALEASGKNVQPQLIRNYQGEDIALGTSGKALQQKDFPLLKRVIGEDIITTNGNTLLGADDKAGIAIIIELITHLINHPEIVHGDLYFAFTSDEEIGRGVDHFDFAHFPADFAYTIDGGDIAAVNYENFNAASAIVSFTGRAIHPGSAKGRLINASRLAMEFDSYLPSAELPELTDDYQGFHHLVAMEGAVEKALSHYIIRNHDQAIFARMKQDFLIAEQKMNTLYQQVVVSVELKDTYYNMGPLFSHDRRALKLVEEAFKQNEQELIYLPIRGGTDGAQLAFNGLLTPNLGTGGYYAHGPYEFVSLTQMQKMVQILLCLVTLSSAQK